MTANRNRIEALTAGEFIVVRIPVAQKLGGLHQAIMLDYIVRWAKQSRDGWVFRTEAQIEADTLVSRHHQRQARTALIDLGVMEEQRRDIPARLHFRIDYDRLHDLLGEDASEFGPTSPNNSPDKSDKIAEQERQDCRTIKGDTEEPQKNTYTREFETWWSAWPKKGDAKYPAFQSWNKLSTAQRREASASLPAWLPYYASQANKYIPNATTWLNQRRWEVAPPPVETQTPTANLTAPPDKRTRIDFDERLADGSLRWQQAGNRIIDRARMHP